MQNNIRFLKFVLIVCLLPLLYINVKDSHDWGDDFAQYLIQARNIVEQKPQTENGLIFTADKPLYAIEAYPVGFPLLLAPVYYLFQLQLPPYFILISLILIATGFICYEFFSKQENAIVAFLITMLFCYNPLVIDLKKQILSEIPFTCLLMVSLLWPLTNNYKKRFSWLITGMIFVFLISIRLIGIIALLAYILFELNKAIRSHSDRVKDISKLSLSVFTTVSLFFILNGLLFPIRPLSLFKFYIDALNSHEVYPGINFDYYFSVLKNFFPFFGISLSPVWLVIAFTGWLIRFIKFRTLSEYFFPLYLLVIIFYPYARGGYRFLIPLLPLLIFYLYYFFNWFFYWFGKKQHKVTPVLLSVVLAGYILPLYGIIKNREAREDGPQEIKAVEMFDFLRKFPDEVPVVFTRSRAMYLYSGHGSMYPLITQTNDDAFRDLNKNKNLLVVISTDINSHVYDSRLNKFIGEYAESFEMIWTNEEYQVYQKRN
jgi:hypothetical protein